MTDDRLLRAFSGFDLPVEPDPAFAERLFGELAAGLRLSEPAAVRPSLGARLLRMLRVEPMPGAHPTVRLSYVAVVVWLLLALVVGALVVGAQLLARPSPAELVLLSQAAYEDPPAFTMVLRDPLGETGRLLSDGTGTYRIEAPGETEGSYYLYDGERSGHYEASLDTWGVGPAEERGGPIWPFNGEFTWAVTDYSGPAPVRSIMPCEGATSLGEADVAGRLTDHLVCADIDMEYWLDRETSIVLRMEAGPSTPNWDISGEGVQPVMEAQSFEVGPVDPALMAWDGPDGAHPEDEPPVSTELVVGEPPPSWAGQTIDGVTVSTDDVEAPAAVMFCWLPSPTCHDMAGVAGGIDGLTTIVVYEAAVGTVAGYARLAPVPAEVVADPDSSFLGAWGITAAPTLVLIDRDGLVAGIVAGRVAPEDLERALRALIEGGPVPVVSPAPEPSPTPSPNPSAGVATPIPECGEIVTCLPMGSAVPPWTGELLDGSPFDSGSLLGRPAIVYLWLGFSCDGPCPDWFDEEVRGLADAAGSLKDQASLTLVTQYEEVPGATQTRLDELGVEVAVVFDWTGAAWQALSASMGGAVVLDRDGRLVDQAVAPVTDDSLARLVEVARELAIAP